MDILVREVVKLGNKGKGSSTVFYSVPGSVDLFLVLNLFVCGRERELIVLWKFGTEERGKACSWWCPTCRGY